MSILDNLYLEYGETLPPKRLSNLAKKLEQFERVTFLDLSDRLNAIDDQWQKHSNITLHPTLRGLHVSFTWEYGLHEKIARGHFDIVLPYPVLVVRGSYKWIQQSWWDEDWWDGEGSLTAYLQPGEIMEISPFSMWEIGAVSIALYRAKKLNEVQLIDWNQIDQLLRD